MSERTRIISELNRIFRAGDRRVGKLLERKAPEVKLLEVVRGEGLISGNPEDGKLYLGDNLEVMRSWYFDDDIRGKISLFYLDPPFFSMSDYDAVVKAGDSRLRSRAYKDSWDEGMKEYLKMLYVRIAMMRELMAEDGLIFCHVDWHAVHFVRLIMDDVFGPERFVNEIIWQYKSGGSSKKHFARKHDNILVYSKNKDYRFFVQKEKSYNRDLKPYRFKGVEEFKDEIGWHTLVNMKDVWEIDMVGRTSGERTGYATQKPEQLMRRIIESATREGDLVADPFCGSGTLGVAAAKMGRRFLMIDKGELAAETASVRLVKEGIPFQLLECKRSSKSKLRMDVEVKSEEREDNLETISVRIRGLEISGIEKVFKEDGPENPLDLLLSWSVGFDEDGEVHHPDRIFLRERGILQLEIKEQVASPGIIGIRATDIFGNSEYLRFDLRSGYDKI